MRKNELENGDIIVLRDGELGLYLAEAEAFIYQESGSDDVDTTYNDDLTDIFYGPEFDVMQVYRSWIGVLSFRDYENGRLVFERDAAWKRPSKEEREAMRAARLEAIEAAEREARQKRMEKPASKDPGEQLITIMTQAFYGNRTGTQIEVKNMDRFILGHLDDIIPVTEKIDRTIVRVPNTDNLVIIYNKYREEKRREDAAEWQKKTGRTTKPLASIPEENIEIYSRCIVCRMNDDGTFASLESTDCDKFMKYLAE